ncbi:MAG: hypothetical protein JW984_02325 [Deltaproteobacteria bacterium]|uniref:Uncharacterized protein n=1 Tax=Candidatus Zymogenus saltonus TaxID=2844893 RepID=A0A9D8PNE8_9DELT|nr:hypothetical protein [Candidatus Zymogenus saltonus]
METTEMKQPVEPMEPDRGKSRNRSFCVGCLIIVLLLVGLVVGSIVFFNNVLEKEFGFEIFKGGEKTEEPKTPDSVTPIPDVKDVVDFTVIEQSPAHMNIGVKPDITDSEIEKLNLYLSHEYFLNSAMYNIAYLNKDAPATGEVIAVYNYNEYTGTDKLTILPKELRYPGE